MDEIFDAQIFVSDEEQERSWRTQRWKHAGIAYRTHGEWLLARVLDRMGVTFWPSNPVRFPDCSKAFYKPDFIVMVRGEDRKWKLGILEIDGASHNGRYAEDQQRNHELQRAGFHWIRHYLSEQVEQDPEGVAEDFLEFLRDAP